MSDPRTKVAVLGGGVGGITAAFELSATPELRARFEVTVYQPGWRLGGKGASGRNASKGNRIEEHGLHIWFGFYDNAFRLMRDAYAELDRPENTPLATFNDAFKPCDEIVLYDRQKDGWAAFPFNPPPNPLMPGDPGELPTFWEIADRILDWVIHAWGATRDERPGLRDLAPAPSQFTPPWFDNLAREVGLDLAGIETSGGEHLLALAHSLTGARARHTDIAQASEGGQFWILVTLLTGFRDWLWEFVVKDNVDDDPDLRLFFTIFDTITSGLTGIVKDGVLERGFDAINDEEWCAWLRRNGAKEVTVGRTPAERSPLLRSVYDVAFGYVDGQIDKANVAAGTATNDLLRLLFSYRGSMMYKMQAGMGDAVFAPLYQVLHDKRGVRFEFFHAATGLTLNPDGSRVESIDVVPQVELNSDDYAPLRDVNDLPCWPSEPCWDQLVDGDHLRDQGVNFERNLNPLNRTPKTLTLGQDFDEVVLAMPPPALKPICAELVQHNERFRQGMDMAVTVNTQAFQLWTKKSATELGWAYDADSVAGCYVEPLDTYADMTHLLPRESWKPQDGVHGVGYFCGVLEELPSLTPEQADARVKENVLRFLQNDIGTLWPAFKVNDIVDQYARANVTPSERYVLTPAGSLEHRLRSDESGFDNVTLAGDWTKNGIDGGCVEAAVASGMQAARSLTGIERRVVGESPDWLQPRAEALPPYIEFGGRVDSPGKFLSLNGSLRAFVLEGDQQRIAEIVRRTLNDPAGPEVEYRALGHRVLLLMGGFERVSSLTPPFDNWGTVKEIQASFWIPVVAGRDLGPVFVAERFGMTVPYIFVDNPMSYLGGRDNYGYPKSMGYFTPETGIGPSVKLTTYGGNFDRDSRADWHPFLEVMAGPEGEFDDSAPPDGPEALLRCLVPDLANAEGEITVPGFRFMETLFEDMLAGRIRQVMLKQFRDATDDGRACYQSVVETPIEIKHPSMSPSRQSWTVTISPLDSHPIAQELGVQSQKALLAFDTKFDMVVENGTEIGRVRASVARPGAPAGPPPSALPGDGLLHAVGEAGNRIYREIQPLLERAKFW